MKYVQLIAVLMIVGLLVGCAAGGSPTETTAPYQPQPDEGLMMCYAKGFSDVNTMMAEPGIVLVRGTPVKVAEESEVGVLWTFEVAESSQAGLEHIDLVQAKDTYLLKTMEEVVLVLEYDQETGRYSIIGGGCGLFRLDDSGTLSGVLADSLLSDSTAAAAINNASGSVLEAVYDVLAGKL